MTDTMNGAQRVHWLKFRVTVGKFPSSTVTIPIWRKDTEDTDDYSDVHPAMMLRGIQHVRERFGADATVDYIS